MADSTATASLVREVAVPWSPTQPGERWGLLDVLRGLALFGVIAANMRGFAGPHYAYFRPELIWQTRLDFWVQALMDTFIQGKFITIFAFLFGVGFALQVSRAEQRRASFAPVYTRRLLALILIGGLHQLLFWWGDVLVTYGLAGFLLLPFRKRKNKTILIWTLALMLLPIAGGAAYIGFRHYRPVPPQKAEASRKKAEETRARQQAEMWKIVKVYQNGGYAEIYKERLGELWRQNATQPFSVLMTLPIFMLGLLVFRRGILQDPGAHRAVLKKALIIGGVIGVPANIAATYIMLVTGGMAAGGPPSPLKLFGFFLVVFGRPTLSMAYACAAALLFLHARERMMGFAAVGRAALSNYLFQTVFCTTIFYGYGGGLFVNVNLAWLMVVSVAVFALQVPLSKWWLARYRFGPTEWVWRSLTYGRVQPMKV